MDHPIKNDSSESVTISNINMHSLPVALFLQQPPECPGSICRMYKPREETHKRNIHGKFAGWMLQGATDRQGKTKSSKQYCKCGLIVTQKVKSKTSSICIRWLKNLNIANFHNSITYNVPISPLRHPLLSE